ncbi:FLYWCH-type domain-containing protein, partial [Aphis craccivora]
MVSDVFVFDLMAIAPTVCEEFTDYIFDNYVSKISKFPPRVWSECANSLQRTTNTPPHLKPVITRERSWNKRRNFRNKLEQTKNNRTPRVRFQNSKLEQTTKFSEQTRTNEEQSNAPGSVPKFKGRGAREMHLPKHKTFRTPLSLSIMPIRAFLNVSLNKKYKFIIPSTSKLRKCDEFWKQEVILRRCTKAVVVPQLNDYTTALEQR